MKCATQTCSDDATHRVFWPGQTVELCLCCSDRAHGLGAALGFEVAVFDMSHRRPYERPAIVESREWTEAE